MRLKKATGMVLVVKFIFWSWKWCLNTMMSNEVLLLVCIKELDA